jgi:hypothetical protein
LHREFWNLPLIEEDSRRLFKEVFDKHMPWPMFSQLAARVCNDIFKLTTGNETSHVASTIKAIRV